MRDLTTHRTSPGARRAVLAALVLAGLTTVLATGCTSDSPSEVGNGLVTTTFDTTLVPLAVSELPVFGALEIEDVDVPLENQQLLYLGSGNGTRSSILLNFDFAELDTTGIPAENVRRDNIAFVRLSLTRASYYGHPVLDPDSIPISEVPAVWYEVHELDAPFDSTAYPAPLPAFNAWNLNTDYVEDVEIGVNIAIDPDEFWNWFTAGEKRGFLIQSGAPADTAFVGYASRDMLLFGTQLDPLDEGTIATPVFSVKFVDPDTTVFLTSYADVSTFHEIAPTPPDPADGIVLRTGLRNYPALLFDFTDLPDDVYINRAVLRLINDPQVGVGPVASLVVSELDSLEFAVPGSGLTLDELEGAAFQIVGITGLLPAYVDTVDFNVTQYVQRRINEVYDGTRGLVVTAGEDFFPLYDRSAADPDFFFREFRFHGTAAAPGLRPELRITYSVLGDLEGGTP